MYDSLSLHARHYQRQLLAEARHHRLVREARLARQVRFRPVDRRILAALGHLLVKIGERLQSRETAPRATVAVSR